MPTMTGRKQAASDLLNSQLGDHRARHLQVSQRQLATPYGNVGILVDDAESPLAWLARRRGRDGRPLIEPHQLQSGERLRAEFTRGHLMPRITSNWEDPIATGRRAGSGVSGNFTDVVIAARQRVRTALDAVGPEFSGLLLDVCCFLKRLEDIERERAWPARSAKVVLQLALDRLARHYGLSAEAVGHARASLQTWLAPDAGFSVDGT